MCPLKYSFLISFPLVHVSTRNSDSHIHKKLLINGTKKAWIYLQCNFALVIFKISEHEWTYIMYIIIQIQSSMFIFPCIRTLIYYNSAQSNFDIYTDYWFSNYIIMYFKLHLSWHIYTSFIFAFEIAMFIFQCAFINYFETCTLLLSRNNHYRNKFLFPMYEKYFNKSSTSI